MSTAAKKRAYMLLYRAAHHEALLAKDRAYYAANREEILARLRQRRAENPAPSRAAMKKWEAKHPEKRRGYIRKYEATTHGRQMRAAIKARRLAKMRGATINNLSAAQWQEIQAAYNYRCVYCPSSCWWCQHKKHALTRDHIDPVVKGGNHTFSNIVPACQKHNSQKYDGPVLNPVQPLLLTIAPIKKERRR